jgi:hypothetical protein
VSTATLTALTPTRIDALAEDYLELKERIEEAKLKVAALQEPLDKKADELRDLVREHGSAHAEKSRMLHGVSYEIMATFSQSVSIDGAAVEKLREASTKELNPRQFGLIFEKVVGYRLLTSAAEYIRTDKISRKLKAFYAACQVIKDKTPALTVRLKNA